jgi:3D-(3,5/4)-trihydroxycyclohexane-1,2-dione acylhydrolase (decyclizing)
VRFIHINVCGHDAFKMGALPLVADARNALQSLQAATQAAGVGPNAAYIKEVRATQDAWMQQVDSEVYAQAPGEIMSQGQLLGALNDEARAGDSIVAAAGSPPGDLHKLWDVTGGRTCYLEFGFSCMGFEIPAGLGVRMAQPEGEVYVFIGDGTYLMNPTELVTAIQEGLKVTVVLSENHGYQVIRQLQMGKAGRSFGNEFRKRDASKRLEGEYLTIDPGIAQRVRIRPKKAAAVLLLSRVSHRFAVRQLASHLLRHRSPLPDC